MIKLRFSIAAGRIARGAAAGGIALTGVALLLLPHAHGAAETHEMALDEIVDGAPAWSITVKQAELDVAEARGARAVRRGLDSTELALSGNYIGAEQSRWSAGSEIGIEPLPQVGVAAGVESTVPESDETITEQTLSATLSPLARSWPTWSDERAFRVAAVRLRDAEQAARRNAEERTLAVLVQRRRVAIAESLYELRTDEYDLKVRRREVGDASFSDVQDAQAEMLEARRALFSAQQQLLSSEADLNRVLPLLDGFATPAPLPIGELKRFIDDRNGAISRLRGDGAADTDGTDLEIARAELEALEAERATVRRFRPDLTVRGGVTFSTETEDPTPTAGIELRLSPSQNASREQRELDQRIALQRLAIASERAAANLDRELAASRIEIAREALAVSEVQLQRDRSALEEGRRLLDRGVLNPIELRTLEINVAQAETAEYQAAVDLYTALGEYCALLGCI